MTQREKDAFFLLLRYAMGIIDSIPVEEKENITVILNHTVEEILGDNVFEGIVIRNADENSAEELSLDGMFVAIGLVPQNEYFQNVIKLDDRGYADYGEELGNESSGIFVAGDCRRKQIRQVVTAASDGAAAAMLACDYINVKN
jgi:thioredoxin reductase (NADPH)